MMESQKKSGDEGRFGSVSSIRKSEKMVVAQIKEKKGECVNVLMGIGDEHGPYWLKCH